MSLLVTASVSVAVPAADAWRAVVDWAGQGRWIPFTTVRVTAGPATGLGCRVEALSGFRAAGRPIGLLDRFVVTGWTPPAPDRPGEVEVLHLGPGFTGVGVIRVVSVAAGSIVAVTESFDPPGGFLTEPVVRPLLPALRAGLRFSLRRLAALLDREHRP